MRPRVRPLLPGLFLVAACSADPAGDATATSSLGAGGATAGAGGSAASGAGGAHGTATSGAGGGPECFVRTGATCPPGTGMIQGTAVDVQHRCRRAGDDIALCTTRGDQTAAGCLVDPTTGTTYVVDGIACRDGRPWVACSAEVEDQVVHDGNAIPDCVDAGG